MAGASPLLHNTKFEDLCRLCGSKTDMLAVHIFSEEGTFSELGRKIYSCLQLQIQQQDELPKLLCENCLVKLEMFWDFKDRSFRTAQILLEVYKQLKTSGIDQQQCLVTLNANGINLQIPNNESLLPDDLSGDIDISQLGGRRDNSVTDDYGVVLDHDPHLNNLHINENHLNGNHNLHGVHVEVGDNRRYPSVSLSLIQQHLLPSLGNNPETNHLSNLAYTTQENSLGIESNLSDNSLGVEVDSHFNRIISCSSESQIEPIHSHHQEESNLVNQAINVYGNAQHGDLTDFSAFETRTSSSSSSSSSNLVNQQNHFFKFGRDDEEELAYNNDQSEKVPEQQKSDLVNIYKEDVSLDSLDSFKNHQENSNLNEISTTPIISPNNTDLSNESSNVESQETTTRNLPSPPIIKSNNGKICNVCGKIYKTNYKLTEHMTKHTGERPHKCKSCDKAFRSKIGLAQHEAVHTGNYDLRCPTCDKGFQCRSYLMVHQRVHSDLKPFPCGTCGMNFKTKQSLLDHTNRHLGVKPFSCSICNRGFITKSLCAAHEKTHSGVDNRKYSCKICQKRFVSKSYLQTHSRIHTGEKTFICEVCGKGFLTGVDLKIHLTMHTGEKSYVCEMCGKAFARRDALKCHIRLHTGERPYRCDICGRGFTQFTPMANHKKHHTGEKPFSCETCGKTFVSRSSMGTHQKKHIRAEKDPESQKNDKELDKNDDENNAV